MLSDLFDIKRGLATGGNNYFISSQIQKDNLITAGLFQRLKLNKKYGYGDRTRDNMWLICVGIVATEAIGKNSPNFERILIQT